MTSTDSTRAIAAITDEGEFERLAMAILRKADVRMLALSHPGVNAEGRTVKSPVDGVGFVPEAVPAHLIAVHHTTVQTKRLKAKWLHDPAAKKIRSKASTTASQGDIVKTIAIVTDERKRTPDLRATLILTTTHEPGEDLQRDVHAAGAAARLNIEIWSGSRLADFLDNDSRGHWIRYRFFGSAPNLLCEDVFLDICKRNLESHVLLDDARAWVERSLDQTIADSQRSLLFIIAGSGAGKTVACQKRLQSNLVKGGFSLILSHDVIETATSLKQAIETTLLRYQPELAPGCGAQALALAGEDRQLILSVEDLNRSGRGALLVDKLVRWDEAGKRDESRAWQLLCPLWPQLLPALEPPVRKAIDQHAVFCSFLSPAEGADAVMLRRKLQGLETSSLDAASVAATLGYDPLLISLHDPVTTPDPSQTIAQFVERSLQRLFVEKGEFSPAEYKTALIELAKIMLIDRQLDPVIADLASRPGFLKYATAFRQIVHQSTIIRIAGSSAAEAIAFRHDRVRAWLLVEAARNMMHYDLLPDDVLGEPYYAEIIGAAIVKEDVDPHHLQKVALHNPLALFYAVRHLDVAEAKRREEVLTTIHRKLDRSPLQDIRDDYLKWEAMKALAESEGPYVPDIVAKFDDGSWEALRARYRNGDVMAGIGLCLQLEPGVGMAGHEEFLTHVQERWEGHLVSSLGALLAKNNLEETVLIGALRLIGHLGVPSLANDIRSSWSNNARRDAHLDAYLWACAQCVDDDPDTLLGPVCDSWAALPDTADDYSPRDAFAQDNIRWAFNKRLPPNSVRYLALRAAAPDLKSQITHMLHGVDHPDAVEFVVRELSSIERRAEENGSYSWFDRTVLRHWEDKQRKTGSGMTTVSRARLFGLWSDPTCDRRLRHNAFKVWSVTHGAEDLATLRGVDASDELADEVLRQRLKRGDQEGIPALIAKLSSKSQQHWWSLARYIWSDRLTVALDGALARRSSEITSIDVPIEVDRDRLLAEVVTRLPPEVGAQLLQKHWAGLKNSKYFVIAGLHVATPNMRKLVADAITAASDPSRLLDHLMIRLGHRMVGFPGVTRREQIEAIVPHLEHIAAFDIDQLRSLCDERGWLDLRRSFLDDHIAPESKGAVFLDTSRIVEALDAFVAKGDRWINYWLDDFLQSGGSRDKIISIILRWLRSRGSLGALRLACSTLVHLGDRRHIDLLQVRIEPCKLADAEIENTIFAIKRRSIRP